MLRYTLKRALVIVGLGLAVADTAAAASATAKASDWLGHSVTTRDGKELGTVRDLAIDEPSGKVVYLVVSVGSFLIENNLIAVAPEALVPAGTADGTFLLLADPNGLREAKRFASDGQWPKKADVIRSDVAPTVATVAAPVATEPAAATAAPSTGTATIESRSKSAKLSASERVITETPAPVSPPKSTSQSAAPTAARPPPLTQFDHLDKDGDGVLNRSEFAQVISPRDSYSKIDTNANGVIEPQEFDAYQAAHPAPN